MRIVLIALGVVAVVVVLGLVAIALGLQVVGPTFCDLVGILYTALVAGEAVWDAIKDFATGVTDSMIADLPEDTQTAARAVLSTAKQIAGFAFERLIQPLLRPFVEAVKALNGVCERLA